MTDFDDDEWIDLERTKGLVADLPLAQVRRSKRDDKKATAWIALRRELAEWAEKNGPRFKVQIGGDNLNKVRIQPDAAGGRFEHTLSRGTARIALGHVNVWPNAAKEPEAAKHRFDVAGALVLELSDSFARAEPEPLKPAQPARSPAKPAAFPITTRAHGLEQSTRGVPMGEPGPGRSALDQRKAGAQSPPERSPSVSLPGRR